MLNEDRTRPLEDALQRLREAFTERVVNYPRESSLSRIGDAACSDELRVRPGARPSRTQLEVELKRVDAALARLQAGTFGTCCRCHVDIDLEWLTEDPATPFCRPCFNELATQRQKLRR